MRIDKTGLEFDELGIHRIVHTCRVALIVGTGALYGSLLIEVVESYIIGIVCTTATEVDIVVLPDTCLEDLVEPVGISAILEMVLTVLSKLIAAGKCSSTVGTCLTDIVAVLVCIHQIIYAFGDVVYTEIATVVYLQRLILTTMLGGDDDHTVTSTRSVDSTGSSILQDLNGLNIISGEVADRCTHWHTINNIKRCGTTKSTDTTNTYRRICARLAIGRDLHTWNLTLKHRRDVGVGYLL